MRRFTLGFLMCLFLATAAAAAPVLRVRHARIHTSASRFTATAYCRKGRTESGLQSHTGMLAADPRVLPIGSVVRIVDGPYAGVYTVADTGGGVKGRRIDIFVSSCARAVRFGRRSVD